MQNARTKARVICNPASGGGSCDPEEVRDALGDMEVEWVSTEGPEDARKAAEEFGDGLLVVAGGDGTVNEVVNGLGKAGFPEGVTLALFPMGTGNDLAATLAIADEQEAQEAIRQGRARTLDVVRIRSGGVGELFFINVATGGIGAETSAANDEELKRKWGKLSYPLAYLQVARDFDVREVRVVLDGEERWVRAVNVAVGNCRYTGGGWLAVPKANPEDGFLDLVIIESGGLKEILKLAPAALARADYLGQEGVFSARAREVYIETNPGELTFTADGEMIGDEPATFTVIPRALNVVVGADYVPEPEA